MIPHYTAMTDEEVYLLESRLVLRAAALGWTGDPLRQPASVVLAEVRAILASRERPQ